MTSTKNYEGLKPYELQVNGVPMNNIWAELFLTTYNFQRQLRHG